MIVVKIITVIFGLAFLLFGYFIYFQKKYNLINGFSADYQAGRKNEKYATVCCTNSIVHIDKGCSPMTEGSRFES